MTPLFTEIEEVPDASAQEALETIKDPRLKAILICLREHLHHEQQQEQKDSGCG